MNQQNEGSMQQKLLCRYKYWFLIKLLVENRILPLGAGGRGGEGADSVSMGKGKDEELYL
jgi:hypothetical protein